MQRFQFLLPLLFCLSCASAQPSDMKPLPYRQIPEMVEAPPVTGAALLARLMDGMGYRYYWATEGLRAEDLAYRFGETNRPASETLEHLYNLSRTIRLAVERKPNVRPLPAAPESFEEQRRITLENIQFVADHMRTAQESDLANYEMIFQRGDNQSVVPVWNLMNGPIADALTHIGQITASRRASGNPQHPGVNVFVGKTRE